MLEMNFKVLFNQSYYFDGNIIHFWVKNGFKVGYLSSKCFKLVDNTQPVVNIAGYF